MSRFFRVTKKKPATQFRLYLDVDKNNWIVREKPVLWFFLKRSVANLESCASHL
jgi:hypothetical protein